MNAYIINMECSATAKVVFAYLRNLADISIAKGTNNKDITGVVRVFPSLATISGKIGTTERTARKYINELV